MILISDWWTPDHQDWHPAPWAQALPRAVCWAPAVHIHTQLIGLSGQIQYHQLRYWYNSRRMDHLGGGVGGRAGGRSEWMVSGQWSIPQNREGQANVSYVLPTPTTLEGHQELYFLRDSSVENDHKKILGDLQVQPDKQVMTNQQHQNGGTEETVEGLGD